MKKGKHVKSAKTLNWYKKGVYNFLKSMFQVSETILYF